MDREAHMNNLVEKQCIAEFFKPGDINEHIPTLVFLANQCNHVTELGVRDGSSSKAFLYSNATVRSYDIKLTDVAKQLFDQAKQHGKNAVLYEGDSLCIANFEETDLLFIDTYHTGTQLIQELTKYSNHVRKYIVLHDTELFGEKGEDSAPGLKYALNAFVSLNTGWVVGLHFANNNGLTILIRNKK